MDGVQPGYFWLSILLSQVCQYVCMRVVYFSKHYGLHLAHAAAQFKNENKKNILVPPLCFCSLSVTFCFLLPRFQRNTAFKRGRTGGVTIGQKAPLLAKGASFGHFCRKRGNRDYLVKIMC